jgi:hypothetical protein
MPHSVLPAGPWEYKKHFLPAKAVKAKSILTIWQWLDGLKNLIYRRSALRSAMKAIGKFARVLLLYYTSTLNYIDNKKSAENC